MNKKKKFTALEELEDLGMSIFDYSTEKEPNGIKKICLYVQFYNDGSWVIDSMDEYGMNSTIDSGADLRKILPKLKECRDLFLKALKELDK